MEARMKGDCLSKKLETTIIRRKKPGLRCEGSQIRRGRGRAFSTEGNPLSGIERAARIRRGKGLVGASSAIDEGPRVRKQKTRRRKRKKPASCSRRESAVREGSQPARVEPIRRARALPAVERRKRSTPKSKKKGEVPIPAPWCIRSRRRGREEPERTRATKTPRPRKRHRAAWVGKGEDGAPLRASVPFFGKGNPTLVVSKV